MIAEERVAAFLVAHHPRSFCDECLAGALGIAPSTGHRAAVKAERAREFIKEYAGCSDCGQSRLVTRASRSYSKLGPEAVHPPARRVFRGLQERLDDSLLVRSLHLSVLRRQEVEPQAVVGTTVDVVALALPADEPEVQPLHRAD